MPRMIDLIRNSQAPANLMQSAARGSLSVPPAETIEILVYLALHHRGFGEMARLTLAGWDEKASLAAARNPATSAEVLGYLVSPENLRPRLLPALAENPSVSEQALSELASRGGRLVVQALLASPRVLSSRGLLQVLQSNANLRPNENTEVASKLATLEKSAAITAPAESAHPGTDISDGASAETERAEATSDAAVEEALTGYLNENATALEVEKDKPFQPVGRIEDLAAAAARESVAPSEPTTTDAEPEPALAVGVAPEAKSRASTTADVAQVRKHASQPSLSDRRESTLQKIAKLDVKGRIALAIRGSKEERSILIRDGTKVVALAVLESPKITDAEVEGFAQQKNVLDVVLRMIPLKRRFAKNYVITRNLVFNPRTPIDCSLTLIKHLLVHDLKNLSGNKEVGEAIRKLALKTYKQKMEKRSGQH